MAPAPACVRARLALAERQDGSVDVAITTSRARGSTVAAGRVWTPAEFVREPTSFELTVSGPPGQPRRYVQVKASALVEGHWRPLIRRELDLSAGGEERRLLGSLARARAT